MKKVMIIIACGVFLMAGACKKKSSNGSSSSGSGYRPAGATGSQQRGSTNMTIQAYYDSTFFTINLMELSAQTSAEIIAHNQGLNEIYTTTDLDKGHSTFVPVIDAVPTDGFNPMWLQKIIVFNSGYTPHQFYSDDEVNAAVTSGEIHLVNGGEVYRCSVIQTK